ncbi:MAG TPA: nucleotidyl transferase AbiEii/AbiGii toxin family protein [Chloroflexota bacterium]|jgi:hypothetical protein|nr:nucleotidyl transferase AbiEii/AbiGii toxin family protein [Chloroflexota bacterium]
MPRPDRGSTAAGFRVQLLARLRNEARSANITAARLQQRVAFERLLTRLAGTDEWMLKGGFALELRYGWQSRPTRDIDLRHSTDSRQALQRLRLLLAQAATTDPFQFELGDDEQELQGAPGGAVRIRVIARLAGVVFADFHLDMSSGDAVSAPPDILVGSGLLDFAGMRPLRFPTYPVVQHLAEKLHAYTLPRAEVNTRTKDLVDLVMFALTEMVDGDLLTSSVQATFDARLTHSLPPDFPEPPRIWSVAFARLAAPVPLLAALALTDAYRIAAAFWDPVLDRGVAGQRWVPGTRVWVG